MIQNIAYTLVFGKPLIMYGGILAFSLMIFTATVGFLNSRGIHAIPFKWHPWLAIATILVAVVHAIFGLSAFFGF